MVRTSSKLKPSHGPYLILYKINNGSDLSLIITIYLMVLISSYKQSAMVLTAPKLRPSHGPYLVLHKITNGTDLS